MKYLEGKLKGDKDQDIDTVLDLAGSLWKKGEIKKQTQLIEFNKWLTDNDVSVYLEFVDELLCVRMESPVIEPEKKEKKEKKE